MGAVLLLLPKRSYRATWRDLMKCPKCRAMVDDGVDRCTFCGHYFKGSMMEEYKLDDYDPTQGYNPSPTRQERAEGPKSKFRLRLKRG